MTCLRARLPYIVTRTAKQKQQLLLLRLRRPRPGAIQARLALGRRYKPHRHQRRRRCPCHGSHSLLSLFCSCLVPPPQQLARRLHTLYVFFPSPSLISLTTPFALQRHPHPIYTHLL